MFDRDKDLNWKFFKDIWHYCGMTTPGGNRNELDARFVSLCATFNINSPTDAIVHDIYKSILRGHLINISSDLHPVLDKLITITLNLFKVSYTHIVT